MGEQIEPASERRPREGSPDRPPEQLMPKTRVERTRKRSTDGTQSSIAALRTPSYAGTHADFDTDANIDEAFLSTDRLDADALAVICEMFEPIFINYPKRPAGQKRHGGQGRGEVLARVARTG